MILYSDAFLQLWHHALLCITECIFSPITSETVFQIPLVAWVRMCAFLLRPGHCQDFSDQSLMILQMTWLFTGHLDSFQTSVTYVFSSEWAELSRQWRGHASSVTLTTESTFCCHFVASHYPNENMTGRNVTQNGHGWTACQNSFTFLFFCECRQRDYGDRVEDGVIMPQAHGQHLNPPVRTDVSDSCSKSIWEKTAKTDKWLHAWYSWKLLVLSYPVPSL